MSGTEIIKILSNDIEGVVSAVAPIVGALFTAVFLRKDTATKEFEKVKTGKFGEVAEELLTSGKMTYSEYYKANNFLDIAKKADMYCYKQANASKDKEYEFDWFIRFYEAAGNVSDEMVQDMWARVLAGEISGSSTFSLKTLDVMRNLGKQDAELFAEICSHSFVVGYTGRCLPNEDEYLKIAQIRYDEIMKLSELGLIYNDATLIFNIDINEKPQLLVHNNELAVMISSSDGKTERASIKQYPFTEAGKELSTVTQKNGSSDELMSYARMLVGDSAYKVSVHKLVKRDDQEVMYETDDLMM